MDQGMLSRTDPVSEGENIAELLLVALSISGVEFDTMDGVVRPEEETCALYVLDRALVEP